MQMFIAPSLEYFLNKGGLIANLSTGKQKASPVTQTCVEILDPSEVLV